MEYSLVDPEFKTLSLIEMNEKVAEVAGQIFMTLNSSEIDDETKVVIEAYLKEASAVDKSLLIADSIKDTLSDRITHPEESTSANDGSTNKRNDHLTNVLETIEENEIVYIERKYNSNLTVIKLIKNDKLPLISDEFHVLTEAKKMFHAYTLHAFKSVDYLDKSVTKQVEAYKSTLLVPYIPTPLNQITNILKPFV